MTGAKTRPVPSQTGQSNEEWKRERHAIVVYVKCSNIPTNRKINSAPRHTESMHVAIALTDRETVRGIRLLQP